MHNLLYISHASRSFEEKELDEMLESFRARNAELNITGLLLYDGTSFMQLLEGERQVVHELFFKHICLDSRHTDIGELFDAPIVERAFVNWSMGFKVVDEDIKTKIGFNRFLDVIEPSVLAKAGLLSVEYLLSFRQRMLGG